MAGYIPWFGKKRAKLQQREQEFMMALRECSDLSRLAELAEEIRAAQIRTLKSKRAQLPPSERNLAKVEELSREIAQWIDMPAESIVAKYRRRLK